MVGIIALGVMYADFNAEWFMVLVAGVTVGSWDLALLVFIDPYCGVDVRVELLYGEGGAVGVICVSVYDGGLMVPCEGVRVVVDIIVPDGKRRRGRRRVESFTFSV